MRAGTGGTLTREVVAGGLSGGVRIAPAAVLGDKFGVLVLLRVPLARVEEHVLQEVRESRQLGGVRQASYLRPSFSS